jgi:hypothetical protein
MKLRKIKRNGESEHLDRIYQQYNTLNIQVYKLKRIMDYTRQKTLRPILDVWVEVIDDGRRRILIPIWSVIVLVVMNNQCI